jgi:4-amino-4-deoxy-L-arabinose transferase-like glycosyltransferase
LQAVDVRVLWGVGIVAALLYFIRVGTYPFIDPPEGLHAEIAREMWTLSDWVTPRFDGIRYFDKPPILYWLISLSCAVTGASEAAARFWPAMASVVIALVTARLGSLLYSDRAGLIAGLAVVTNLEMFIYGRLIKPDTIFILAILVAYAGFLIAYHGEKGSMLWLFYAGLGLAVLSKDLLGALGPLVVVALFLWLTRDTAPPLRWLTVSGVAIFAVITVPWHALMDMRNPGFLWYTVVDNHVLNFTRQRLFPDEDVPLTSLEFLGVTVLGFFPWSFALPWAFHRALRRPWTTPEQRSSLLLGLWGGAVLLFFTLAPFKLPHYALPAFPALALLIGKLWDDALGRRAGSPSLGWLLLPPLAVFVACAGLFFAAWLGTLSLPAGTLSVADVYTRNVEARGLDSPFPSYAQLQPLFGRAVLIFAAGSIGLLVAWWRTLPRVSLGVLFATLLAFLPVASEGMALMARHRSVKPLVWEITRLAGERDVIVHEGALENSGSLVFYTRRRVKIVDGKESTLAFGSTFPEARAVFWSESELRTQWMGDSRIFLVTLDPPERSVVRSLPSGQVHLLKASGGRWLYSNRP